MEKIRKITKKVEENIHEFYCDNCKEYLGSSYEYDDGWYPLIGKFELKLHVDDWYCIKKCLCDDCAKKFMEEMKLTLANMGFERD